MRINRSTVITAVCFIAFVFSQPANAQFGAIKKGLGAVKDKIDKHIDINTGSELDAKNAEAQDGDDSTTMLKAKAKKLEDGETAVISTSLSPTAAASKVKALLDSKDVDYTVNPDTGRIISDWFGERRCGPGFNRCANKATVRVVSEEGQTLLRVQVVERKREGGINEKPWKEGSTSKGKQTAEFAAELEAFLTPSKTASR